MMIIREIRDVRAKVGPFVGVCNGSRENREACVLSSRARTRKREAECVMNDPRGFACVLCFHGVVRRCFTTTARVLHRFPWIAHSGLSPLALVCRICLHVPREILYRAPDVA